jgi:hypothetical protein
MSQIRNLLCVLAAGAIAALLFVLFLVHSYGPTGRYEANNVLIAPNLIESLAFDDIDPKTGASTRFVFDTITFTSHSPPGKNDAVTIDAYAAFYQRLSGKESIANSEAIDPSLFSSGKIASLDIIVKTKDSAKWQKTTKILQHIELAPESFVRVQLRDLGNGISFAYFVDKDIYNYAQKLFFPSPLE